VRGTSPGRCQEAPGYDKDSIMKKNNGILITIAALFAVIFFAGPGPLSKEQTGPRDKSRTYPDILPKSVLTFTSLFNGRVLVIDDGEYRSLVFGSETSSATQSKVSLKHKTKLLFNYTQCSAMGFVLFRDAHKEIKNVLMIGLGGGSIPRFIKKHFPVTNVDSVEIDPLIVDLAKKYFFVEEEPGFNIFVEDGRRFVENTKNRYDVVILDAFGGDSLIPPPLTSYEFLSHVKSHLSPGGIIITNFINHDQRQYESIVATYARSFTYVMRFNLDKFHKTNVVIMAFDDVSKNIDANELARRAGEFSKFLKDEYDFKKFAVLCNGDELSGTGAGVIHDK
jgi:spermidine synthase